MYCSVGYIVKKLVKPFLLERLGQLEYQCLTAYDIFPPLLKDKFTFSYVVTLLNHASFSQNYSLLKVAGIAQLSSATFVDLHYQLPDKPIYLRHIKINFPQPYGWGIRLIQTSFAPHQRCGEDFISRPYGRSIK